MFDLRGLKGAYLNNYAVPTAGAFVDRIKQVDYVVIKYGMGDFEKLATHASVPWLAEIYPYRPSAKDNGSELALQAKQPGCVGAVVNFESGTSPGVADWDSDDGSATRDFVTSFRAQAPGVPLYVSIDTRGYRPTMAYQRVLLELADGVFPMVFPKEFQQGVPLAIASVMPGCAGWWQARKPAIVTFQGYNGIGVADVVDQVRELAADPRVDGVNIYTIGHASDAEWDAFINTPFRQETNVATADYTNEQIDAKIGALLGNAGKQWEVINAIGHALGDVAQTVSTLQTRNGDANTAQYAILEAMFAKMEAAQAGLQKYAAELRETFGNDN